MKWKDVKTTFICSLHFEAKCFVGKRLQLGLAVPTKNIASASTSFSDHSEIGVEVQDKNTASASSDHTHRICKKEIVAKKRDSVIVYCKASTSSEHTDSKCEEGNVTN